MFLVCDIADAFYKVPLALAEQLYFVLYYGLCYYIWTRFGQGSLNGPTLFGRFSAFLGRATQAILHGCATLLQIYTDDPIIAMCSDQAQIEDIVIVCILLLEGAGA